MLREASCPRSLVTANVGRALPVDYTAQVDENGIATSALAVVAECGVFETCFISLPGYSGNRKLLRINFSR